MKEQVSRLYSESLAHIEARENMLVHEAGLWLVHRFPSAYHQGLPSGCEACSDTGEEPRQMAPGPSHDDSWLLQKRTLWIRT